MLICPRCKSDRVHFSRVVWLTRLASLFKLKVYRCTFCHKVFFRSNKTV
jgi:phage FluMu protein Com